MKQNTTVRHACRPKRKVTDWLGPALFSVVAVLALSGFSAEPADEPAVEIIDAEVLERVPDTFTPTVEIVEDQATADTPDVHVNVRTVADEAAELVTIDEYKAGLAGSGNARTVGGGS